MRFAIGILALAILAGCGGEPGTPEAQVRAVLDAMETAAEEGDVSTIRELVSEAYQDERGNDKRELVRYVAFHVLRNQERHVLVRVRELEILEGTRAIVILQAAMAGSEFASFEALSNLRADIYQIAVDFALEDAATWRLIRADWNRIPPSELL